MVGISLWRSANFIKLQRIFVKWALLRLRLPTPIQLCVSYLSLLWSTDLFDGPGTPHFNIISCYFEFLTVFKQNHSLPNSQFRRILKREISQHGVFAAVIMGASKFELSRILWSVYKKHGFTPNDDWYDDQIQRWRKWWSNQTIQLMDKKRMWTRRHIAWPSLDPRPSSRSLPHYTLNLVSFFWERVLNRVSHRCTHTTY